MNVGLIAQPDNADIALKTMKAGLIAQAENAVMAIKTMKNECWVCRTIGKCRCGYKNNAK